MIVCAYAATGKSTLAKIWPRGKEITSMQYAWMLPPRKNEKSIEHESEKAASYLVRNIQHPMNMLLQVLKAESDHGCVIIPTINALIQILQEKYGRNVVLCYPEDGLEQEYRSRMKMRGNSETFVQIFVNKMQLFLEPLKDNKEAHHIVLKSGEYLSDKLPELEQLLAEDETMPVSQEEITVLEEMLLAGRKGNGLIMLPLRRRDNVCYLISDMADPEDREFIYKMGRKLGDGLSGLLMIVDAQLIAQMKEQQDITIVDAGTFEKEVDNWLSWNAKYFSKKEE